MSTANKQELFDFLSVAKEVRQNVFGKWGLVGWSDIKPRGTREKAYLVLKTTGKPLHFREIASLIDTYGLKSSKKSHSHPQTVHNELIKDNRFVLVGRGTYALSEWGYKKGTVKEVLEEILRKSATPLSREEVLTQILKVRQVKKSTVIINLNTFFSRVGKNAYSIKK
jgi:predicted Zn-ribbon and HTH transcriptional regulator